MRANQNITLEMLEKFKNETLLNDEVKTKIYESIKDSIRFQEFCKNKGETSHIMIQEINIDIYKEEYKCVYTRFADMMSMVGGKDYLNVYFWTENGVDIDIDSTYKKNRKVPVFVRKIIDEMLKFELIKEETK